MGWLRNVRDAATERAARDPHFERNVVAWKRWASEQGWTYQAEAPDLVGRYEPEYSKGAEHYYHLLTTQLHGLRATAFEHRTAYNDWKSNHGNAETIRRVNSFIVLELPGLPPEEFMKMGAEKAIRKLGGDVPGGYDLKFFGAELVARTYQKLVPLPLQFVPELMALQVMSLPASFWRPTSSSGGPL